MLNATKDIISTKKQQLKGFISRTKTERKILMGGAGLARPRILISLMKRLGLGGQINLDTIGITDRRPPFILGTT